MRLSTLGIIHTIISIVAVITAFVALYQDKGITSRTRIGRIYLVTLLITCVTGFPIFRDGKVTPAFILGGLTLGSMGLAFVAGRFRIFGRASKYVEAVAYSSTVLFLMIPTVTEPLTRLPTNSPLVASPEAPIFMVIYSALLVLFLIGATLQVRRLRVAQS